MQPEARKIAAGVVASVAFGILIVVLAASVLRPTRSEVIFDDGPAVANPEPSRSIVALLRESGGFSLFGIRFADTTNHVEVRFLAGRDCAGLLSGRDPWPSPHTQCSAPVELVGKVGGIGIDQSGNSLVGVEFEVPRACFEQLEPGMEWPPDLPECALH